MARLGQVVLLGISAGRHHPLPVLMVWTLDKGGLRIMLRVMVEPLGMVAHTEPGKSAAVVLLRGSRTCALVIRCAARVVTVVDDASLGVVVSQADDGRWLGSTHAVVLPPFMTVGPHRRHTHSATGDRSMRLDRRMMSRPDPHPV